MSVTWNPWHGCRKVSAGCVNCYVYRIDARFRKGGRLYEIPRELQHAQAKRAGIDWRP